MVRRLLLTLAITASAMAIGGTAWADITILVPSGSEGDGLRAAATDYSKMKGSKVEIVQAPYANVFEKAANGFGQVRSRTRILTSHVSNLTTSRARPSTCCASRSTGPYCIP